MELLSPLLAAQQWLYLETSDDGYYNNIPLGFNFNYDGYTYNIAVGGTNGWLSLIGTMTQTAYINNLTTGNVIARPI